MIRSKLPILALALPLISACAAKTVSVFEYEPIPAHYLIVEEIKAPPNPTYYVQLTCTKKEESLSDYIRYLLQALGDANYRIEQLKEWDKDQQLLWSKQK